MRNQKQNMLFIVILLALIFIVFGVFYRKQQKQEPLSATAFKLNTVVTVTLYDSCDQKILDGAMELCDQYEKIFSRTEEESELFRLNHGEGKGEDGFFKVSEPLKELISLGLEYGKKSKGAFDISIYPVSSLWDFTSGEKVIPQEKELKKALELVQYQDVEVSEEGIRFAKEGMGLDLGAIAKGYIADQIKEYLIGQGVNSALIDLGGNVLCVGQKPDGAPFRIGIQRPFAERSETVGTVEITDQSVVSSGIYERYFEKDHQLYHHILNPKDGFPYDNGLTAVTIISKKSVDGDGLSTSCFALGLEKGMELINSLPDVHGVFMTEDGKLHYSEEFQSALKFQKSS
jgi:thiamine biosynthesis lipoprotein